jgi:hypothetical protein
MGVSVATSGDGSTLRIGRRRRWVSHRSAVGNGGWLTAGSESASAQDTTVGDHSDLVVDLETAD